jgi:hypothetical protein
VSDRAGIAGRVSGPSTARLLCWTQPGTIKQAGSSGTAYLAIYRCGVARHQLDVRLPRCWFIHLLGVCPCVATGVRWDEHRHISDRILYFLGSLKKICSEAKLSSNSQGIKDCIACLASEQTFFKLPRKYKIRSDMCRCSSQRTPVATHGYTPSIHIYTTLLNF